MTIATVTITCTDRTHEGKKSIVTRFVRPDTGDDQGWQEVVGRSARLQREGKPQQIAGITLPPKADKPEAYQGLRAGDAPGVPLPGEGGRMRYRLSCEWCGRTVPVRAERLTAILDTLAMNGVHSMSLSGLAATLH